MMMPSAADFDSPVAADVEKYFQGAGSTALERSRIYKLAWDLIGSEFADLCVIQRKTRG